jgi:hypothetical protein
VPQFDGLPVRFSVPASMLRSVGVLGLSLAFLAGGPGFAPAPASAQGFFNSWGDGSGKPRKKIKKIAKADDEDAGTTKGKKGEAAAQRASGPLVINVSLRAQRLTVYDATGPIAESPVSSGRVGYSTPMGVFTVLEKRRMHHSNLYAGAPMPNMQRLTWSGVALHAGVLPGYPASHGCIRLPHGFSKKLFGMTANGTRVIVSRDPVRPVSFAHERLFAAFPPETGEAELRTGSLTQVADASSVVDAGQSVSSVLGVSTAAAAGVDAPSPGEAARVSFRERRRLEAERLQGEIREAGYEKATRANELARAYKASEAARAPLVAARAEAERLADELAKLEKAKVRAERELAELTKPETVEPAPETKAKSKKSKKAERKRKPKVVDKAKREARIAELNQDLSLLPGEIAQARAAWEAADASFKAAEAVAKAAEDKRRAALVAFNKVNAVLAAALGKEAAEKRLAARRHLPVSVFISRAKQRLYIRQGWDDILDVAVTFDRPEEPVGTHVFTALSFNDDKTGMNWSAVSVPYDPSRGASKKKKAEKAGKSKKVVEDVVAVDLKSQTPAAALERITIPEDVREQIADVMKPGSSLVISDLGLSNETGEYTDLIAAIR